eukprot:TRINITY_DN1532_c0_g1_i1.p1 TRINITY_DN1532_c0_g1~~TRINITY_DN1532_c0_g1_i1.p1  ORF type:complete len:113 (+),score=6.23 TRINITY_DN1532_c0_g1_i1:188-526(+)
MYYKTKELCSLYDYIIDYQDFLYFSSYFANKSKEYNMNIRLAPELMRDFVWHTHLMFPNQYNEECARYTDRNIILDHTDLIVDHLPFSAAFLGIYCGLYIQNEIRLSSKFEG